MTRFVIVSAMLAIVVTMTPPVLGENSILIESKQVPTCADSVSVGVFLTNDVPLQNLFFPLRLKSVDSGAFTAGYLEVSSAGRLRAFDSAEAYIITRTYSMNGTWPTDHRCPMNDEGEAWDPGLTPADHVSPDALLYGVLTTDDWHIFDAGSDGSPDSGSPSLVLSFGVSCIPGVFEIDTTCIPPYARLGLYGGDLGTVLVTHTVTKSTIEIGCECQCHTDPQCDGYYDIIDWMRIRDVARGSHAPIPDPNPMCPVLTTDVNCDGVTNNTDKNLMYEVIFNSGDPDTLFCDPCP